MRRNRRNDDFTNSFTEFMKQPSGWVFLAAIAVILGASGAISLFPLLALGGMGYLAYKHILKNPKKIKNTLLIAWTLFGLFLTLGIGIDVSDYLKEVRKGPKVKEPITGTIETKYFDDARNWIKDGDTLQKGMETFYDKTGIQPYLLTVDYDEKFWSESSSTDYHYTSSECYPFLKDYYDHHFSDNGHFIVGYFSYENDSPDVMNGDFYYYNGRDTYEILDYDGKYKSVGDNVDKYYKNVNYSLEERISIAFNEASKTVMNSTTTESPKIGVPGVIYVLAASGWVTGGVYVAGKFNEKNKTKKEVEDKIKSNNERKFERDLNYILNEEVLYKDQEDVELEDLEKKYGQSSGGM